MNKIVAKHKQSLFDIAIEQYGSMEAVEWLVEDNESLNSIIDTVYAGDVFLIRDAVMNKPVQKELEYHEVVSGGIETHPEGVGFWGIERDFIIQ